MVVALECPDLRFGNKDTNHRRPNAGFVMFLPRLSVKAAECPAGSIRKPLSSSPSEPLATL